MEGRFDGYLTGDEHQILAWLHSTGLDAGNRSLFDHGVASLDADCDAVEFN